jgi:hypothetical protein
VMRDRHPQDAQSTYPAERERFSVNSISKPPNASCTDFGAVWRVSLQCVRVATTFVENHC